jgi:hypothetical protein
MAEKKFFVDINLQGSALTNAKIGTNTGIGSTEGAFGYDSAAHRLQYFDGTATKEVANLSDIAAVTGGLILQGGYNAATDTPNITDGSAFKGFFWVVTEAGTFLGESVQVGDSIIAKVDEAGATLSDWLILQGNVVIATDSVDGISRLATQTEANDGTEAGAVVITPATLQGKIDAQITPEINDKLSKQGGSMSGDIHMSGNQIAGAGSVVTDILSAYINENITLDSSLDAVNTQTIINLPAPTNGGDAANKTYVDDQDALKLSLTGGTMSGSIDMGMNEVTNLNAVRTDEVSNHAGTAGFTWSGGNLSLAGISKITNLTGTPTLGTDATNKTYVDNNFLSINGGTLNGELSLDNNKIVDLAAPINGGDATNKTYVDDADALKLDLAGGTMTGTLDMGGGTINNAGLVVTEELTSSTVNGIDVYTQLNMAAGNTITNLPAPTADGDAANKIYVDDVTSAAQANAQDNANAYTDSEIAALSFSEMIATGDWTLSDGVYSKTITHNLGVLITFTAYYNGEVAEFKGVYDNNTLTLTSNIEPTSNTVVNIIKAGGNL